MPGTTTRLSLPYPLSTEPPNGPSQIQALANALDGAAIDLTEGTLAARPAAAIRGRWYYANDVAILYRDSGSTWRSLQAMLGTDSITAANIAADAVGTSELAPSAVTNAEVAAGAAIAESKLSLASDAAPGTASRRTLGPGPSQAAPGDDARLSDQRVPTDGSVTLAKLATAVQDLLWKPGDLKSVAYDVTAGSEPTGWLLCDGRAVSRTGANAALFAKIGTAHGVGDGSTTFNLPDYRGRVLVGKGTHADVDTVGKTDAIAVASRRVKHTHIVPHDHGGTTGFQGVQTSGGPSGVNPVATFPSGSGSNVTLASQTHVHDIPGHSHTISTESPATDSQGPAYGVTSPLIKL